MRQEAALVITQILTCVGKRQVTNGRKKERRNERKERKGTFFCHSHYRYGFVWNIIPVGLTHRYSVVADFSTPPYQTTNGICRGLCYVILNQRERVENRLVRYEIIVVGHHE